MGNKALKVLVFIGCLSFQGIAQSIPIQLMVVDSDGFEKVNHAVKLRLTLTNDTSNTTGQYQEVHLTQTNDFGILSESLGTGVPTTNSSILSLSQFSFTPDEPLLKVEIDTSSGFNQYHKIGWVDYTYPIVARRALKADSADFSDTAEYARNFNETFDGDTSDSNELQELELVDGQLLLSQGGGAVSIQSEAVLTTAIIKNWNFVANDSIIFIHNRDSLLTYSITQDVWDTTLVSELECVLPELNLLLFRSNSAFILKSLNNTIVDTYSFLNQGQIADVAVSDSVISFKTNINGGNSLSSFKWVSIDLKDEELSSASLLQFEKRISPSLIGVVGTNWGSVTLSTKNVDDFTSSFTETVDQIGYDKASTGDYFIDPSKEYLYQFKSGAYTSSVASYIATTFKEYGLINNDNSGKESRLFGSTGGALTTFINYGERGLLMSLAPSTKVAYGGSPTQFDNYLVLFDWNLRDWRILVDLGPQYLNGGYRAQLCSEYLIVARIKNPIGSKSIANGAEVEILKYHL